MTDRWHEAGPQTIWFQDRMLYGCVDYWLQYCDTADWEIYELVDGVAQGSKVSLSQVADRRPRLWVTDVIAADSIRMMMQPIVQASDNTIIGYEMLARGYDSSGKLIPPTELFAAAKDQNQLFLLDRSCRIQGIRAASRLSKDMMVFINFVPTSIYVPEHCLQTTMAAVKVLGIHPSQVVFEVVETERVEDLQRLKGILQYYRAEGFRYALDDVGQGFNDTSVLRELEPDVVKLDRAYVSGIEQDREKQEIAQTVLRVAESVGATALAEGIETAAEARVLRDMGYVWQQGYYYGKPSFDPLTHVTVND